MSAEDPERAQRELEALLRRAAAEPPAPAARAEARRAFLAGDRDGSQAGMGARREKAMPGLADRSHADLEGEAEPDGFTAWLGALSQESPPRAEAQRRARLAFLSAAAEAPPAAPPSRSYRALVLLAAAAAIALVTFLVPEPDRWHVQLSGELALDEQDFAPGDEDRLAAELEGSGWIETRGTRARFTLAEVLEVELLPGSALRFPPLPELDGLAPLDFELTRGEAYLRTVGSYPGNPIRIHTDVAEVVLSGTTVGVLVDEAGTCVCVAEGSVNVTGAVAREAVAARHSLRLFRDGSKVPESEPFPAGSGPGAEHVLELLAFQVR